MSDMVSERELPESSVRLIDSLTNAETSTWNILTTKLSRSLRSHYDGVLENLQGAKAFFKSSRAIATATEIALATQMLVACAPKGLITPKIEAFQQPSAPEVLSNDRRQGPDQILKNAFDSYNNLRQANPNLGALEYHKPLNYMDYDNILGKIPTIEGMEANDIPQSSFLRFSVEDIHGPKDLIEIDPGSGIVDKIVGGIKDKFGSDPYTDTSIFDKPEVVSYIKSSFSEWFSETQNYILEIKRTRKATVDDLILYHLEKNNGDIMKSLWDTTLFLKIAARNDPGDLSFGPTLENVKFLARNIQDDFSEEPLSDVLRTGGDPYSAEGIVPRSGIIYHAVNIIALEGCMDSTLVEIALRSYYFEKGQKGGQASKMSSDMRVIRYSPKITYVLDMYAP